MDKKIVTVTSESELKNAVEAEYDIILIGGDYAQKVAKNFCGKQAGSSLSDIAIVIGMFFWTPALIAGVAGKVFTRKFKKYEITEMDDEFVTIKKKKVIPLLS